MAKDFLAFMGLIFLTLIILAGVLMIGVFYDQMGMVSLPEGTVEDLERLTGPVKVTVEDSGIGKAEWTNPLEMLPTATLTPYPTPAPTLVPALDPGVYRTEGIVRLKRYAAALENWLDANEKLAQDNSLMNDPNWQDEIKIILGDVKSSGQELAELGPAPAAYEGIEALLNPIGVETERLVINYSRAVETGDSQYFLAASDHFARVKEYLTQAAMEMVNAGWALE